MVPEQRSQMLEEIGEQPGVLARTLEACLEACRGLKKHFSAHRPDLVMLVARGTSDNAAQFGRYLFEISGRIPTALAAPSVYTAYGVFPELKNALVIGISQSGESTDINAFLGRAHEAGAMTIGITNEPASAMTKIADCTLPVTAGKEKSVAATKSYTGQQMALYTLAEALGGAIDLDSLRAVPEAVSRALELDNAVASLAAEYRSMDRAVCIGRGLNYGNALEWSLKMMETCQVVAQPFSAADFLHGPIAMLDASFPAFVFGPPGATASSVGSLVDRLVELRADVLLLGDASFDRYESVRRITLTGIPASESIPDLYTPIPYIVPAQLFAAHLAAAKDLDPDRPRGLTKVTKTM